MKTEWVHKKLGDCCESELGKTLDEGRNTGLYRPYLCALNVLWGKIDISIIKQMRIEDSELERYLVKKGDLLVCEGGEIGRCAIWENDDEIYYQNALHRVRFYKEYDAYFFMYLLCHYNDLKLIEQYGKGLTIKHLNQTAFRNIPVCIPDLFAQRRIAAILASADKVIAATQKTIAKYKQIKQGMIEDLLKPKDGWKKVKLGEVVNVFDGTHQTPYYVETGIPFYSVENVTGNDFEHTKYITEEEHSFLTQKHKIEKGDILMTRIGSIGVCKFVNWNVNASFYVSLALLKIKEGFDAEYLVQYSQIEAFKKSILHESLTFAYPQKINLGDINNVEIAVPYKNGKPDLAEQRRIAAILSGIDAKIAAEEKVLQKYEKVKKGLMERLLEE